jgi:hypothetical protein
MTSFSNIKSIGGDLEPEITLDHDVLRAEFLYKTPGYGNMNLLH